jgi:hypothetical protein
MGTSRHLAIALRAVAGAAVLLGALAIGAGTTVAAPPVPFTVSPTTLSFAAAVNGFQYQFVTVTTGKKAIVLDNPATFGSAAPFFDTQAGSCWQNYGSLGTKIPANTNCTIQVGYHPTSPGSSSNVMTIYACKHWHITGGQTVCDVLDGSRTVSLDGQATTPTCSYTPGTTGCIVLTDVAITDSPSTATYTLSGNLTFTPTCQNGLNGCSYDYPNIVITGSGTFTVTGSQQASGTWTVPAPPNDRPDPSPYQFTDASANLTTCAAAVIRQVTLNIPLVASNSDTGGGVLSIRTDDVGSSSGVAGTFSTGQLPTGTFLNPAGSQTGVTILC